MLNFVNGNTNLTMYDPYTKISMVCVYIGEGWQTLATMIRDSDTLVLALATLGGATEIGP
jgi:hypothetical protein